jgi:hypothetical protein
MAPHEFGVDLSTLPPIYTQVLQALQLPDPAPRHVIDGVVHAVARRLPGVPEEEIARAIQALNALRLVMVPYVHGSVAPRATADANSWITAEGWEALRTVVLH